MNYMIMPGIKERYREEYKREIIPELIIEVVCKQAGFTLEELIVKNGKHERVMARYSIYFFIRKYTSLSLKKIGDIFFQDHTTVIHGLQTIKDLIETDPNVKADFDALRMKIVEGQNDKKNDLKLSYDGPVANG